MTNPLDDALQRHDNERNFSAAWRADQQAQADLRWSRCVEYVRDFLVRMNRVANKHTTHDCQESRFRKVPAWFLIYELGGARRGFLLTVDGRTPPLGAGGSRPKLAAFADVRRDLSDKQLDRLAQSMAEIIRR